ncbi:MAG: hypothetical protein KDD25_01710, partial [Bdellovibrionales bacterium]|nr:hypothetical protein [Bdellovibrionales bacterium]
DLKIDSVWVLVQALRNHVKSYRRKYYYSYTKDTPDEEIVAYIKAVYKNILAMFGEFKPDVLVMPNFASLQHILFSLYAKNHGVKVIGGADARFRNRLTFFYDYLQRDGLIQDKIAANRELDFDIEREVEAERKRLHSNLNQEVKIPPYFKSLSEELRPFYWALKFIVRNKFVRWTGGILDSAGVLLIRDWWKRKVYIWKNLRYPYDDLGKIGKFVYVPLQFQPEMTIDVFAARLNNQLEFVRQVAMSCPGDYVVVVKEHPAMIERRSPAYFDKIARLPNVKAISPMVTSEEVLRKADLVVTPNGTTCIDCAFLKKPVIQMGDLGLTLLYPNVIHVKNWSDLSHGIRTAVEMKFDVEYESKLKRTVAGVIQGSFDYRLQDFWEKGEVKNRDEFIDLFVQNIRYVLDR